jgi:hypothetical protein
MDIFYVLKSGSKFNRERFGEDIEVFEKVKNREEEDNYESAVPSDLDFFGCGTLSKKEHDGPNKSFMTMQGDMTMTSELSVHEEDETLTSTIDAFDSVEQVSIRTAFKNNYDMEIDLLWL